MAEFTKADLRTGYIVELRNGESYMVYLNATTLFSSGNLLVATKVSGAYRHLSWYTDDLTHLRDKSLDIVKVKLCESTNGFYFGTYYERTRTIWERKVKPKKMTVAEIEEALGYPVKIVK